MKKNKYNVVGAQFITGTVAIIVSMFHPNDISALKWLVIGCSLITISYITHFIMVATNMILERMSHDKKRS